MLVQLHDNHIKNSPLSPYSFKLYLLSNTSYPHGVLVAAAAVVGGRPYNGVQSVNLIDSRKKALTTISVFTLSGPAPETETEYHEGTPFAAKLTPIADDHVRAILGL